MDIVEEVIDCYGGVKSVQERFGYSTPMAIYNWRSRGIPKGKLIDIHLDTGLSLEKLSGIEASTVAA